MDVRSAFLAKGMLLAALGGTSIPVAVADVVLYQDDDFRGRSVQTDREIDNLKALRFNDVASSIEVRSGTWQICDDAGYGGQCETLRPGRYPSLRAMGLNDRVSSVRPASDDGSGSGGGGRSGVTLYEHDNYNGRSYRARGGVDNLKQAGFNDMASSVEVQGGSWEICDDAGYRGQCETLAPGRYASLREFGLNDRISSIRPATSGSHGGRTGAMLYENDNYSGRSFEATREISNLKQSGFNDMTSSIEIRGGAWQICDDANFGGRCETLEPGRYPSLREFGLNDRVSSLRPSYGKPGGGSEGNSYTPEVTVNRNGAGSVYYAGNDCRVIYDPRGRRTAATGQCNQEQVRRADDEMARYRRERGF